MIGFQEQGLGSGQGISRAPEMERGSQIDTRPPCGCPSLYSHLATCPIAHEEIAALPHEMPGCPVVVDVTSDGIVVNIPSTKVTANELRAIARRMLLRAHESDFARRADG